MNKYTEYEKRCNAIQYYEKGIAFERILVLFRRGRFWLSKWLRRYQEHGLEGLRDRSRAQRGFGEGLRNPWLRAFWPLGRSWNRTRQNVRPFLGLDLRSSAGNSSKGMRAMFLPCLRLPGSFGDTAKPIKSPESQSG